MLAAVASASVRKASSAAITPERWIEIIDAAEAAKLPVLILDSFSHAWEGVGGVLDLHAETLDRLTGGNDNLRNQRSQLAWAQVKPRYRRLIDRIVRAKMNIIICTRAKAVTQDLKTKKNARATKTRREDIPWDPASDADLMFEMTAMIILDPIAPGCPVHQIKVADQFKSLFKPREPMGEDLGRAMAEWAVGQRDTRSEKAIFDEARAIARQGIDAFNAWWNTDSAKANRDFLRTILSELQAIAQDADSFNEDAGDDPFATSQGTGNPPAGEANDTPDISEEQREQMRREIEAELAKERAGVEG